MKSSSRIMSAVIFSLAVIALVIAPTKTFAQSSASAPRDYSFTIPATQPWTDTGVDLDAGLVLEVTASARSASGCDPRGLSNAITGATSLPIASAPAGSLIAKLQDEGTAVLVGGSAQLKVTQPGHLFFGVNGQLTPPCTGSFAVKVHVASAAVAGNALTSSSVSSSSSTSTSSPTSSSTSTATTSSAAPAAKTEQDIKSKLASAAQVFLAGQFGTGGAPASNSSTPLASDAAPPNSSAAPATPALKLSATPLDSGLRKDIDALPRRVNDQFNNQGDMVNFVLVGSQEQVQSALDAANWRVADIDNKAAVMKAVLETYQKQDYLQMPMSQLYLFGRKQDFGYELAQAYSVVASRHHFRIWKAPATWNGQTMWAGAGTHDIGFEKDQRNGSVTHKIDPAVDGERDNIGSTLQEAGKVQSMSYYLPPDPVAGAKNATGGGYHSDGRILVIVLK
jgi:hypothetical protein